MAETVLLPHHLFLYALILRAWLQVKGLALSLGFGQDVQNGFMFRTVDVLLEAWHHFLHSKTRWFCWDSHSAKTCSGTYKASKQRWGTGRIRETKISRMLRQFGNAGSRPASLFFDSRKSSAKFIKYPELYVIGNKVKLLPRALKQDSSWVWQKMQKRNATKRVNPAMFKLSKTD